MKLTTNEINTSIRKQSVGGLQLGQPKNSKKMQPDINKQPVLKGNISQDEFIVMEEYSRMLPRGNRKLRLNVPLLRNTVLSNVLEAAPLTKTSGLNSGGNLSLLPKNPKSQKEYITNIKNKNSLKQNPSYSYFKNDFKI